VGEIIKFIRMKNHLTQEEFAARIDLTRWELAPIEKGKTKISVEVIRKISDVFNVPMRSIIGESEILDESGLLSVIDNLNDNEKKLHKEFILNIQDLKIKMKDGKIDPYDFHERMAALFKKMADLVKPHVDREILEKLEDA